MNRKGTVEITLLVVMILILAIATIFIFGTSEAITSGKMDLGAFGRLKDAELVAESNVKFISEDIIINRYDDFAKNNKYLIEKRRDDKFTGEFSSLHSRVNENFWNDFDTSFFDIFDKHNFSSTYKDTHGLTVLKKKLKFKFNEENMTADIVGFSFIEDGEILSLKYRTNLSVDIKFSRLGLHSFKEIYEAKEKCDVKNVSNEYYETCYEKELPFFDVEVKSDKNLKYSLEDGDILVKLSTKRKYYLDGEIRAIDFEFVPK